MSQLNSARSRGFSISNLLKRSSSNEEKRNIHMCALNNDIETVKSIIKKDKYAVYAQDSVTGQTALHIAVFEGFMGMTSTLLEFGSDVNKRDHNGWTPLHSCCKGNSSYYIEIAQLLITSGKSQVNALTNSGGTPLHYFVQGNTYNPVLFEETIHLMLEHGADINSQTKYGETPLHLAASRGKLLSVQLLIKFGANIILRNKDGETALHLSIKHGYVEISLFLIENGADPTIESSFGCCRHYCHQYSQMSILGHLNTKLMLKSISSDPNNNLHPELHDSMVENFDRSKRKLEIDPEFVDKIEKMGYDSASIMVALFNLHKRGKPTDEIPYILAELDGNAAKSASECKVCLEETTNCVVLPCRHSCMCFSCANLCQNSKGECPICRSKIEEIIQIYLS